MNNLLSSPVASVILLLFSVQHPSVCAGPVWSHVKLGPQQALYSWTGLGQWIPQGCGSRQDATTRVCFLSGCTRKILVRITLSLIIFFLTVVFLFVPLAFRCGRTVTSCGVRSVGVRSRYQRSSRPPRRHAKNSAWMTAAATLLKASRLLVQSKLRVRLRLHCWVS